MLYSLHLHIINIVQQSSQQRIELNRHTEAISNSQKKAQFSLRSLRCWCLSSLVVHVPLNWLFAHFVHIFSGCLLLCRCHSPKSHFGKAEARSTQPPRIPNSDWKQMKFFLFFFSWEEKNWNCSRFSSDKFSSYCHSIFFRLWTQHKRERKKVALIQLIDWRPLKLTE